MPGRLIVTVDDHVATHRLGSEQRIIGERE
jgi:hypothetical protein